MENLQEAAVKICELKGQALAKDAFIAALIRVLPADTMRALHRTYKDECELAQSILLAEKISDHVISAFEHDSQRVLSMIRRQDPSHFPNTPGTRGD